jgi:glycosyltransferase involved in cell wall biosynthesis
MNITGQTKNFNGLIDEVPARFPSTLVCFSHLRWNFVYQRPQHLLSRFATRFNVFFVEEPYYDAAGEANLSFALQDEDLWVVTPHLPAGTNEEDANRLQKRMLDKFLKNCKSTDLLFWYYTPMALKFSAHYNPSVVVYDCMDELSLFKNAPAELKELEHKLMTKADIVFTGGHSLYKAKKHLHPNIFPFPSSIDKKHFEQARVNTYQPVDQQNIKGVKLGFYGVIDERFDIELLRGMAEARPDWNFVILGPVVKINPDTLPRLENIHYLGSKTYNELPLYLSGWDIALVPFMLNDSTKFISPTKTPEYLAAGRPVISTPITDVVSPYGEEGYVEIAKDAEGFINAAERILSKEKEEWLQKVDEYLTKQSWSLTYKEMMKEIVQTLSTKFAKPVVNQLTKVK